MEASNLIQEVNRYLEKTQECLDEIRSARSAKELRDGWEGFVDNFSHTIGRLIVGGKSFPRSRPWAHKLKNLSSKADEGLVYLREARNTLHHGLRPFAGFRDPMVSIGGAIAVAGNSEVTISDCSINGKSIKNIRLQTKGGYLHELSGESGAPIFQFPSQIMLRTLENEEKKKSFPVPKQIYGRKLSDMRPISLAEAAEGALSELVRDFERLIAARE